jgi:membrane fusion protein, multidrug efflux system
MEKMKSLTNVAFANPGKAARKRVPLWGWVRALLAGFALFIACDKKVEPTGPLTMPAAPVTVAPAAKRTMPLEIRAIGNVFASATVSVLARVGGALEEVHFRQGAEVEKGQLLFVIDPRPYEVALKEAEAYLARDQALLERAEADLKRYAELVKQDFVTQEQYDQARASAASLVATVQADEAAVKNARLQLSYCYIYAPIAGRTGDLLVDAGNLIKANGDSPMVVINQVRPIEVSFSVPEEYLPKIRLSQASSPPKVTAFPDEQASVTPAQGSLVFVNNTVDTATGTILLKASFKNEDGSLWPGQFVNVALSLGEQADVVVIPTKAIQSGQQGSYVFVVKDDRTVESRPVVVSRTVGEETVIEEGIAPGETLVTDGQLRLAPGARVEIKVVGKAEEGNP